MMTNILKEIGRVESLDSFVKSIDLSIMTRILLRIKLDKTKLRKLKILAKFIRFKI